MAITQGNKVEWADIATLFTRLSAVRKKFSYSEITPSDYGAQGETTYPSVVSNMKALIGEMSANNYAKSWASTFTSIEVPESGDWMLPLALNTADEIITRLEEACVFCSWSECSWSKCSWSECSFNSWNACSFNGHTAYNSFNTSFSYNGYSCSPYRLCGFS